MPRKSYIESIGPAAQKIMHESGLLASLTIAQATLESGNGESELARVYNNHFGIKGIGDKGSVSMLTTEYVDGHEIHLPQEFRSYSSIAACFSDRTKLLHDARKSDGTFRYRHLFGMTDFAGAANAIRVAGYATDPNYTTLLIQIHDAENLSAWDVLPQQNPVPEWAADAIKWANENKVSDCFRLADVATRAEVITMIYNTVARSGSPTQ